MAAIIAGISPFSALNREYFIARERFCKPKLHYPQKTKPCRQRDGDFAKPLWTTLFYTAEICAILLFCNYIGRCVVKRAVLNLSMKIMHTILLMAAIGIVFAADAAAQAQISDKKIAGTGKIEVLWLGQSATRITTVSGKVIVIDPFLTQNPPTVIIWVTGLSWRRRIRRRSGGRLGSISHCRRSASCRPIWHRE
jgi:hypothetical protein